MLHGLVMDMYDQFVAMVAAGRHMDPARVRELGRRAGLYRAAGAAARPDRRDRRRTPGARLAGRGARRPGEAAGGGCRRRRAGHAAVRGQSFDPVRRSLEKRSFPRTYA